MATKGPSNHYGNARGGRQGHETKHTGFAWAKAFNKSTLDRHYKEHGRQVGANSREKYAAKAIHFANNVDRKNNITMKAANRTTYKFSRLTHEFAIITKKGIVITYFKPSDGIRYFNKQK